LSKSFQEPFTIFVEGFLLRESPTEWTRERVEGLSEEEVVRGFALCK